MCIPCWPWTDIYIEDAPKKKKERKEDGVIVYDPIAGTHIKLTGVSQIKVVSSYIYFCLQSALYSGKCDFQAKGKSSLLALDAFIYYT